MEDDYERYRLIAQSTSDLICTTTVSLNPKYTYVSPSYESILGYKESDLIGKPVWELLHPSDKDGLLPLLKTYLNRIVKAGLVNADRRIFEKFKVRIKDKEGRWHYLQCTANLLEKEFLFVSKDITDMVEVESKFKESESLLSLILQSTGDGILVGLRDGSFVYANERFRTMWGIPLKVVETKSRKALQKEVISHLKDPKKFLKRLEELYNSDEECLDIIDFKDGRVFERYSVPLYKEGNLWGRLWSFRDVTERVRLENERIKRLEFEKKIFDSLPYPAMLIDEERRVVAANKIASELGAKIGDYCWKEFGKTEFISESDRERFKRGDYKGIKCTFCLASEAIENKTTTHSPSINAFGKVWNIFWKYVAQDERGSHLYLHYAVDITEYKQAQNRAEEMAKQWSSTFDAISDPVFIEDLNHNIIKANRSFCDKFRVSCGDAIGSKCYRLVHKSDSPVPNCPLEETKKTKKPCTIELEGPAAGIYFLVTASPLFDDKGELIGAVHISKDISDIKKVQQELEGKIKDLQIFHKVSIGREKGIIELKSRIKELEEKLKQKGN